jgi:hypothetical protein
MLPSMTQKKQKTEFTLSRDFQDCAELAHRHSYRKVTIDVTHHAPHYPHVLDKTPIRLYDRIETGLYDLVIMRSVLENPGMAQYFMPYLSPRPDVLPDCHLRLMECFHAASSRGMKGPEKQHWITQTNDALEKIESALENFPKQFDLSFAGRSDVDNVGMLEADGQMKILPRCRGALQDWLMKPVPGSEQGLVGPVPLQASAPLHAARINVADIRRDQAFEDAKRRVQGAGGRGPLILPRAPDAPQIILF